MAKDREEDVGVPEGNPELQFEEDEDLEVIVSDEEIEPEPEIDPEKEKLRLELEKYQQQLEQYTSRNVEAEALRAGIAELGDKLTPQQQEVAQQRPQESDEEWAKRIKDEIYDDPLKILNEYMQRKVAPVLQQQYATNEKIWKRQILSDPQRKETYEKYRKEVEEEYNQIPEWERYQNPDTIIKAHDAVVARHINEIIDERIQAALNDAKPEVEKSSAQRTPTYSEPGYTPAPRPETSKRTQARLTTREAAWADRRGLTRQKAYEFLTRNPEIRRNLNA